MFEQGEGVKELWIMARELQAATPDGFYRGHTLEKAGFAAAVWKICMSACAERGKGGRPWIFGQILRGTLIPRLVFSSTQQCLPVSFCILPIDQYFDRLLE